jgi:branched-chain amino acid transport system permease protein
VTQFLQLVISGLAAGSVYGIVALGFVLVFKATDVFNFAQGALMMLGAFLATTALGSLGLPFAPGILLVLAVAALIGIAIHLLVIRPLLGKPLLTLVMVTIALSLIIEAVVAIAYGPRERVFPSPLPNEVLDVGGVRVSTLDLTIIGISLACVLAFGLFFRRSRLGLQMRATAENPEAAVLSGVNSDKVFLVAFAVAVMLASVGGILLANLQLVRLSLGDIGLLAFPAAVIGGLTSIPGAVVGGLLVGVLQKLGAGYVSTQAQDVFVYLALLAVLMIRPWGLFGEREVTRV